LAACAILPALNVKYIISWAESNLHHHDEEIRLYAAAGLLHAGIYKAGNSLADLLLEGNELILSKARHLMKDLRMSARHVMSDLLQKKVVKRAGMSGSDAALTDILEKTDERLLRILIRAYEVLDLDDEKELIVSIIEYREFLDSAKKETKNEVVPEFAS